MIRRPQQVTWIMWRFYRWMSGENAKHSEEVCAGEVLHGMYGCCKQTVCEGSSCTQLCSYVHTELKFYQYKTLGNHQNSAVEKRHSHSFPGSQRREPGNESTSHHYSVLMHNYCRLTIEPYIRNFPPPLIKKAMRTRCKRVFKWKQAHVRIELKKKRRPNKVGTTPWHL